MGYLRSGVMAGLYGEGTAELRTNEETGKYPAERIQTMERGSIP